MAVGAMTLTQKILAHHAKALPRSYVRAGDVLDVSVDWTLASELAWNGMERTYQALERPPLHDASRVFLAVDHTVDPITLATDARAQALTEKSRRFARERGLRHFYDANQTILHTKFYRDLVQPGQVVLGADSHTSSHGGMGAFAVGLGGADVTAAMVLGRTWIEVPEAIRVEYQGELPFGIGGKDVILRTLGQLGRNTAALERSVEYGGSAAKRFSTDLRFTLANMTAELGGFNGIFEADEVVSAWLAAREGEGEIEAPLYFRADEGAPYAARYVLQLERLAPQIAKPFSPDNVCDVDSLLGLAVHGCFIGACTTTEEELVLAALVLEQAMAQKPELPPSPKKLVVPGDLSISGRLHAAGLWRHYERAGFRIGPPGCSMCLGVASEKAQPGEVWLSSQNRNYENRMGPGSLAYLASAATVAASSLELKITDPRPYLAKVSPERYASLLALPARRTVPEVQLREPDFRVVDSARDAGRLPARHRRGILRGGVQRFEDHVDTDAIIPGEFCHLTTPSELGAKAFFHVRPELRARAAKGQTVIVAGHGWGSGSSREQAVWALQGAGIQVVIAKSVAFIHKRNLSNEGLAYLTLTDPAFYEMAAEGELLEVDLDAGAIWHPKTGRTFQAEEPSPVVRALQQAGGLVLSVRQAIEPAPQRVV